MMLVMPIGKVISMPTMPTSLSTISEAVQIAASNPNCTTPANRTTSPPIVVGRKFEANNPAYEIFKVDRYGIFNPDDRSNTCQRVATAKRETVINPKARTIRQSGICSIASLICSHPCWLSRNTNKERAIRVPMTRMSIDRFGARIAVSLIQSSLPVMTLLIV